MSALPGVGVAVACAVAIALGFARVLRALPVPADDPPPDYAALARPPFIAVTAAVALAAGLLVAWRSPHPWLWLPLLLVLVPACAIDARTTYLPLRLTQAAWALTALVVVATALATRDPAVALRALAAGAILGAACWLLWRFAMIGFGDVRLMLSVGAVTGAVSWQLLAAGVVAGVVVGGVHAAARLARGRRGPFPYGPALLAGPFVALAAGGG